MNEKPKLITCPCCGYKTITDTYDICEICNWENDPVQEKYPDWKIGANGIPLRQAQQNFIKYGNCDGIEEKYAGEPLSEFVHDSDWIPLSPLTEGETPITPKTTGPFPRIFCPCCGYKTITKEHGICLICLWQHELEQERDPDAAPTGENNNNDVTLRQAQQNFLAFGKSSPRYSAVNTTPKPDDERDPNWKPLPPLTEDS